MTKNYGSIGNTNSQYCTLVIYLGKSCPIKTFFLWIIVQKIAYKHLSSEQSSIREVLNIICKALQPHSWSTESSKQKEIYIFDMTVFGKR